MITHKNIIRFPVKYFPALASGLFLTLSFPDTGISWLIFISLMPLLISIHSMTGKEAFYAGFITGVFHFLTLLYWIVPTIAVYGGLNQILSISVLLLLSFYLSLYPALFALILKKLGFKDFCRKKTILTSLTRTGRITLSFLPILAACLWSGLEFIRTYALTGFGWGILGYSQYNNLVFIQLADLTGVYGISFLIVLINCTFALLWINFKQKVKTLYMIPVICTIVLTAGCCIYGGIRIQSIGNQITEAEKTKTAIIQGNIKQNLKWSAEFKQNTIEKYIQLTKSQTTHKPDLVVWPETALPFYYRFDRRLSAHVDSCIKLSKTDFLIGSPAFEHDTKDIRYYNRAYMLDRTANITGTYDKHHLVPFGEYVPFGNYLTFLGKLTAQAGNFSPGRQPFMPLEFNSHHLTAKGKTGVLICFEILFPAIASKFVKNGAHILTTITNDAWFGYSSAAMQHFSIAVFRAVENRRTVIRAANTGVSGFIDPVGTVIKATPLFTDIAITHNVPVLTGISFYTKYGDLFAISSILAICIVFMLKRFCKKTRRK